MINLAVETRKRRPPPPNRQREADEQDNKERRLRNISRIYEREEQRSKALRNLLL